MKDIYLKDPYGEYDFDGLEETEDPEDTYQRDWEASTLYW